MATLEEIRKSYSNYLINSIGYETNKIRWVCSINTYWEPRLDPKEEDIITGSGFFDYTLKEYGVNYDRLCVYIDKELIFNTDSCVLIDSKINYNYIQPTHFHIYGIKNGVKFDEIINSTYDYPTYFYAQTRYNDVSIYTGTYGSFGIQISNSDPKDITGRKTGRSAIKYISMSLNVPIFNDINDVNDYLETGNLENSIDKGGPIPQETDKVFYYDYELDYINISDNKITNKTNQKSAKFKLFSSSDKIGWVRTDDNNYTLQCSNDTVLTFNTVTNKYDITTPFSNIATDIIRGRGGNVGNQYLYGDIETNIDYVERLGDAGENVDDTEPSFNGEDSPMSLTDISIATLFTKPYYVNATELNHIGNIIFANDETFQDTLKKGLWMYNENPIDCVIDLCLYPFDLTPFIDGTESRKLKFGSFEYNGEIQQITQTNYNVIKGCNGTLTLVNQKIIPVYNDFRDFSNITYSLFLPYYGMMGLDNSIVDRVLKIDAKLDIFTSQLKYYIFIDNALLTVCECAVGRHISMIGTDWINKSNKNLSAITGMYSGMLGSVNNIGSLDATGIVNNTIKTLFSYKDYMEKPKTQTTGFSTSGLNIYDPMSVFLITEQYETIKPTNLNTEYGKPTYRIAKINTCSGYTEISDVKLKTRALDIEYNEIVNILKNGIII